MRDDQSDLARRFEDRLHGIAVRMRAVVDAFLSASRSGDLSALIALLDPGVELTADRGAVAMGADEVVRGSEAVGQVFSGRALGAQPALIDGGVGFAWAVDASVRIVWDVVVHDGAVSHINMLADPGTLARLDIELL